MENNTIIIGIAGASASGKSLLARTIVDEIGSDQVVVISEDSYYKDRSHIPFEEREKLNYDHPDAFEHDLLCKHLRCLQQNQPIEVPVYNFAEHRRSETTRFVGKHTIIVIEGILIFSDPMLRELMDIRIYMDTPLDVCLLRRLKRDITERKRTLDSVITQYQQTVRPMYLQFVEPSKRHADIIVPRGGANRIATDIIQAKIRELLSQNAG